MIDETRLTIEDILSLIWFRKVSKLKLEKHISNRIQKS